LKNPVDLWALEDELHAQGVGLLAGVDEAGRGPLAGPVCAAAVILPQNLVIDGLNDSKKLTAKRREILFDQIENAAISFGIAFASVEEIEQINILNAALLAMNRAITQLDPMPELALIDGNTTRSIRVPARAVIGGDAKCASVAAASILAKVTRDKLMDELAKTYPQYGFEKHNGYGTREHYAALEQYGPSPVHRPSFLKKFYANR
jgi:ribonuclease HII